MIDKISVNQLKNFVIGTRTSLKITAEKYCAKYDLSLWEYDRLMAKNIVSDNFKLVALTVYESEVVEDECLFKPSPKGIGEEEKATTKGADPERAEKRRKVEEFREQKEFERQWELHGY